MDLTQFLSPMLCERGSPFDNKEYIFENKFDGQRTLMLIDKKNIYFRIQDRDTLNLTNKFPEFSNIFDWVNCDSVILDGELVLNEGKSADYHNPNFKTRIHIQSILRSKFLSKLTPLTYFIFDVVYLNGEFLIDKPLIERKEILKNIIKENDRIKLVKFIEEKGIKFYEDRLNNGFEGVIAKRKDSIYEIGKRSYSWIKIKPILKMVVNVLDYKETSGWGSHGGLITPYGDVSFNTETERQEYLRLKTLGKEIKIKVRYQEMIPQSNRFRFPKFVKFVEE